MGDVNHMDSIVEKLCGKGGALEGMCIRTINHLGIMIIGKSKLLVNSIYAVALRTVVSRKSRTMLLLFAEPDQDSFHRIVADIRWKNYSSEIALAQMVCVGHLSGGMAIRQLTTPITPQTFLATMTLLFIESPADHASLLWKMRMKSAWFILREIEHDILNPWVSRCDVRKDQISLAKEIGSCYRPWGKRIPSRHQWITSFLNVVAGKILQALQLVGNGEILKTAPLASFPDVKAYNSLARASSRHITSIETRINRFEDAPPKQEDVFPWLKDIRKLGLQVQRNISEMRKLLEKDTDK